MSNSSQNWLSLNLKTSLLVGAASISAAGTTSSVLSNASGGVLEAVKNSSQPIIDPFQKGYSKLSEQLDSFSKQGYNAGVDAKSWVTENLSKSKIKTGETNIYQNLSDWYRAVKGFADSARTTISEFFQKWSEHRETMHVVFKALGNSFSLLGGLMGSFESDGESGLKILFEVIGKPKFKDFMTQVSSLVSKNPNLMSSLEGNDVMDVLSAFRQDEDTVVDTLKGLSEKDAGTVDKATLMNALKLYSLMDKARNLMSKARTILESKDKEKAKQLIQEITEAHKQMEALIKANEGQATE
ncbi:hypothetical protein MHF_0667 [Mycoplasma haemofelis Ohio2]|uniref:Uncharacterized protein n=1 Tax=Mycoplasma haemofelis (strain Ohio2) TaxID=859194 RepID=F6FI91_MYCHI|nr:hypothetical protein MHF_0667 [Mycoplasma haemofelis Ohio2]